MANKDKKKCSTLPIVQTEMTKRHHQAPPKDGYFLQCRESNPGPCACYKSILSQSYITCHCFFFFLFLLFYHFYIYSPKQWINTYNKIFSFKKEGNSNKYNNMNEP
jgi:hypothetical protein